MLQFATVRKKRGWLEKYQDETEPTTQNPTTATTEGAVNAGQSTTISHLLAVTTSDHDSSLGGDHAIAESNVNASPKAAVSGGSSSSLILIIILAVVALVVVIIAIVVVVGFVMVKKKRKAKERLHAALDEEERLRNERKSLLDKPDKDPSPADIDRMMALLQHGKMDEIMRDPSVDANPADVNKMVRALAEKRMAKARGQG
ncbi:hypothetical protein ANCCAN_00730 [Ancylostoma caninum]|uniref:Uncharacterized protein n=1 Tax=Ancylostoma caninum TaxID=29170 RepID=A0A368H9F0_ANCCA|nr:hypothetical protein ANCCAN_00730 [Ancylostoma caninum]